MRTLRDTHRRSRWFMPGFALALGVVFFVAQRIGDDPGGGLVSLACAARPATSGPAASTWRSPAFAGVAYLVALIAMQRRG